jgi:hypothetical protein
MSTQTSESSNKRRTSERRRLKLLKNSKEFKITNPYKSYREPILPEELLRQLRKIDFLSSTSISMLSFQKENAPVLQEAVLDKMGEASRIQEERYQFLFGCSDTVSSSLSDELDSQPLSDYMRKEHSLAEEIITTKEEISLNLYDPRYPILDNMFDCRLEEDERESCPYDLRVPHERPLEAIILEEEYENYFIN